MSAPASSTATLSAITSRIVRFLAGSTRTGYLRPQAGFSVCGGQQLDDFIVADLAEVVVMHADREEAAMLGLAQQSDLVAVLKGELSAAGGRHRDAGDQPPGAVVPRDRECRRERVTGGDAVVGHDRDPVCGRASRPAVPEALDLAFDLPLLGLHRVLHDLVASVPRSEPCERLRCQHTLLSQRPEGRLLVTGISELSHDQNVERALKRDRDLMCDGPPATRDPVDDRVLTAELGKLGREQAAGLAAVG